MSRWMRAGFCVVVFLETGPASLGSDEAQTITRRYTPEHRDRDRYVYVPFEVPAGATELRLRYEYDRANGQNTIDLGLFEPGSLEIGTTAMRGYSGGAKSEVTIGAQRATPGYRAGPLPPGQWHVMLGLYRVAETGVDVQITVETSQPKVLPAEAGSHGNRERGTPTPAGGPSRWWSGALHTHTVHSDGAVPALDLLRRVREAKLDFVTITDHNNTTHVDEVLDRGHLTSNVPLWIAGEEVTTPAGHANVWGLDVGEWVDFRVRPQDNRVGELVATAHRQGALFSINHPFDECAGCSWEHDVPEALDAIEVWNGHYGAQGSAVALWERLLTEGRRVTAVGASDWHRDPDPIDNANVRVFAPELSERAILDAIRAGRVIVMRAASDQTPTFTVRASNASATVGEAIKAGSEEALIEVGTPGLRQGHAVVVANGARLMSVPVSDRRAARVHRRLEPGYVRCEIYDAEGTLVALTNPVFVTR
jgi:hypothetical protein